MGFICGIDEAGRGSLAGPVTAAAVILPPCFPKEILKDSKKLSPSARKKICSLIIEKCFFGIGWADHTEIDNINIHNATLLAMKRAFEEITRLTGKDKIELLLVDGLFTPDTNCSAKAIVKGDDKIDEIKAASIVAKTIRDLWMVRYSWIESSYCFEKHKGYPTALHREKIKEFGLSPIHRKTFKVSNVTDNPEKREAIF